MALNGFDYMWKGEQTREEFAHNTNQDESEWLIIVVEELSSPIPTWRLPDDEVIVGGRVYH